MMMMTADDKSTKTVTRSTATPSNSTKMQPAKEAARASQQPRRLLPSPTPSSLQLHDYLIKVTMFLVTIFCSHQSAHHLAAAQKHYFHPTAASIQHQRHPDRHQDLNQVLQLPANNYNNHLLQRPANLPPPPSPTPANSNNNFQPKAQQFQVHHNQNQNQHHHQNQYLGPAAADRRNAGDQAQTNQSSSPNNEQGKMLVCYYTSRQSPPYWPAANDPRSYVLAPDSLNSINHHQTRDGFSPILQYEPFVAPPNLQQQLGAGEAPSLDGGLGVKNQQQQLVFKSAGDLQHQHQQPGHRLPASEPTSRLATNTNNNGFKNKQQYQEAVSHLLATEHQQHHFSQNNPIGQQQPSSVVASAKNKQPAYSFVGNNNIEVLESMRASSNNNGLIVGGNLVAAGAAAAPASAPPLTLSGHNGRNNGNGGGYQPASAATTTTTTTTTSTSTGTNNKLLGEQNNGHLERSNPMKQQAAQVAGQHPQLVFAPSLSRAFVAGGPSNGNANANNHNEVLDTKSQLFIPSSGQQQQLYGPGQTGAVMKGKSLGDFQHQKAPSIHPFASPSSSAPSLAPSLGFQRNLAQQQPFNMQPASTGINQLIIGGPQQLKTSSPPPSPTNQIGASKQSPMLQSMQAAGSTTSGATALSSSSSPSSSTPGQQLPSPGQQQVLTSVPEVPSAGAGGGGGGSSSNSLSGALVSSPLSTMFDVFGAASQYLMRFKPSSLISPSAFVFNTIAAADGGNHHLRAHHHHHLHQHHPHGLKSGNGSSGNGAGNPTSSLLPLSFSSSLLANMQKSASPASSSLLPASPSASPSASSAASPATDQVGAQLGAAGGILSRFSLQNNQRREEVCGRTIQTPQRRIIGGEGARYGEFPYQVHIKIAKHQCGGALVDKQSIVTAAHCVYHFITRAPVSKLQIVIGAYDIEDEQYQELPPQYFKVNKVKLHPNFRFSASHPDRYDIAILKLDKPVKYTDNVLPVCLPSKDLKFESMVGTVTGFGKTDPSLSNRYGTRLLQKVDVPIIENNECERWHRTRGIDLKIFPEMMCAGYEDGLKDACVGDSGGPLVVKTAAGPNGSFRWTLAGITSAGFGCAQSRQPGIYHRVSHTVDWILENLD